MFARHFKKQEAFTMMEIMLVITVIAILFMLLRGPLTGAMKRMYIKTTTMTLNNIKQNLTEFRGDVGRFPTSKEGLEALIDRSVVAEKDRKKWVAPYGDKEIPKDGWNNEFVYNSPPQRYKKEYKLYELYSLGPDGEESTDDIDVGE